jgi:hypothetical protein
MHASHGIVNGPTPVAEGQSDVAAEWYRPTGDRQNTQDADDRVFAAAMVEGGLGSSHRGALSSGLTVVPEQIALRWLS